jgi:hypothetical protein
MSSEKNTIGRVMELLGYKKSEVKIDLIQKKTSDGETIFDSETFAIGEPVFIVTQDGNIPVPEGEYALEDGTTINVDATGIIIEVSTAGEEASDMEPAAMQNAPMKEETGKPVAAKTIIETMTKETHYAKHEFADESGLVDSIASIIEEKTPEAVTPEIAQAIASVIADKIVTMTDTEEGMGMIASYKNKDKTKMSSDLTIKLAQLEAENNSLKDRLASEEGSRTVINPEAKGTQKQLFKLGARREETISDRVMNSLFN